MDEKKEKAQESNSLDESVELCNKEGIEIPDELLDSVAGGFLSHEEIEQLKKEELRRRGIVEKENKPPHKLFPSL